MTTLFGVSGGENLVLIRTEGNRRLLLHPKCWMFCKLYHTINGVQDWIFAKVGWYGKILETKQWILLKKSRKSLPEIEKNLKSRFSPITTFCIWSTKLSEWVRALFWTNKYKSCEHRYFEHSLHLFEVLLICMFWRTTMWSGIMLLMVNLFSTKYKLSMRIRF